MKPACEKVSDLLAHADVHVGGDRLQDIQVLDDRAFETWLSQLSLGFGESYMKGWWSSRQLDETMFKILDNREAVLKNAGVDLNLALLTLKSKVMNRQSIVRSRKVGEQHYDISTDLYEVMLDPYMQYSCAYWDRGANDLETAQRDKLQLIGEKLQLREGMRLLDIGCGWGGLAGFMHAQFGVTVVGLTISAEQKAYAEARFGSAGVTFLLQDYREFEAEPFDRIVSVGMLEHVGHKNFATYFRRVSELLKPDGLALIHSIGDTISITKADPWIDKYIFPGGMLPSARQITQAVPEPLVIEDWHNFGAGYDRTLMAWYARFQAAWPGLSERLGLDEEFRRMWEYYLCVCAANFRTRKRAQLWQIVLGNRGVPGGYRSVR